MVNINKYLNLPSIISLITASFLFYALADHDYSYFQFLRVIVCGAGAYIAFQMFVQQNSNWKWIFIIIAILFNPFLPIHLSRGIWQVIDLLTGSVFLFVLFKEIMKKHIL